MKVSFVTTVMQKNDLPYWEIFTDSKKTPDYRQSEKKGVDESIEELESVLQDFSGTVYLKCSNYPFPHGKGQPEKYILKEYTLKLNTGTSSPGIGNIGGDVLRYLERIKDKELEIAQLKFDHHLEAIKRQLDDLKQKKDKENENGIGDKLLEAMAPSLIENLPSIISGMTGNKVPVASAPGIAGVEDAATAKQRTIAALNRLQKIDPNLPDTLTLLADFAEKKPSQYLSFIPIVKSQL